MLMKKLFTLFVSLWMAIASLFAANISANTVIYFDASAYTNIQTSIASGKTLQMLLGHSSWSQGYKMTAVDGYDNIYSVKMPKWDGCTQLAFCTVDAEWGGEGSSVTSRLNWTYEKTAVHSISSNMSGNVGFAGNPLTRTNNYTLPVKAPVIKVGAAPEFATTTVGETANATVTYTLENATEATATIEGEGFSIAEQSVGSVTITFAPEAEGDYTGTLTITSGEVKETVALAAKAVAAEAPKVPEFLNVTTPAFGEITEGETATAEVTYELVNATEATATIAGEGFSIKAQELGKVTIEFAPATAGEYTGTLTLTSGETVKEIALTATAKKAPVIVTIGFVNPDWTEAAIWAWIEGGANLTGGTWPGKLMTKGENGKFTYELEIPEDGNYKFIINNNNKGVQSNDLPGVTESTCYVIETLVDGKFSVAVSESCEYQAPVEPDPIEPYVAIRGTMTNWDMANDIKMSFNETANEWSITKFAIEAGGKFKVVSVDAKGTATWYGTDKVDLQEGLTNAGEGDGDIDLGAGTYDIYFKVAEGRIWIQKYVEPTPEPDPIDPYAAIRGLGEGTEEEAWSEAQQIKLALNEDAEQEEWFIQGLEIAEGQAFKVVYVNAKSETTWYGVAAVEENEELGSIGEDNITLAAGKYDLYFKTSGSIWIAPVKAEEPEPEPEPVVITFVDDVTFPKTFVGETTNDIIEFTLENAAEDAEVVVEVTGEAFSVAEVKDNFIYLAFAPEAEGEYAGVLTVTVGEVSESLEFTAVASPVEVGPEPEDPVINVIEADFTNNTTEVGDQADASIVYSLENAESATVTIEGEYVTFEQTEVDEGFMIAVFFTPEEAGEFPGKVIITAGEVTEEIEFTFIATEPEDDPIIPDPENLITFTVQVPAGTIECYVTGAPLWNSGEFLPMERVEGKENMFTVTTTKDVLDGTAWKYCSGEGWQYVEKTAEGGDVDNRTVAGNPDVVAKWGKIYDPDFEPIEPYYAIRGLNGDALWTGDGDIKLKEREDGLEWSATGFTVSAGESFKVIYIDENNDVTGWYGSIEAGCEVGQSYDKDGNIILPEGKYDLYFKTESKYMWIAKNDTPTDAEEAVAELIYAIDGTIYAPAPFAIIDLAGKDVTNANGDLEGAYIVKTQNSVTKVLVK